MLSELESQTGGGGEESPEAHYRKFLELRLGELSKVVTQDNFISNLRMFIFIVASGLGLGFVYTNVVPGIAFGLGVIVFAVTVIAHNQVVRRRRHLESSRDYFQRAIDRIQGAWAGRGDSGKDLAPAEHIYAADLDILGEGSVFELVSQAQTGIGRQTIKDWLLDPGSLDEARQRQKLVRELADQIELRESLVASAGDRRERIAPRGLIQWVEQSAYLNTKRDYLIFVTLFSLSVSGVVAWALVDWGVIVFLAAILAQGFARLNYSKRIKQVLAEVSGAQVELEQMARILSILENAKLEDKHAVATWRSRLDVEGASVSARIRALSKLVNRADSMGNQIFVLIGLYFGWDHMAATKIEAWRLSEQAHLPNWLVALGEFEALISFSTYAFEHPENTYPEFCDAPSVLELEDMRHPLLERDVAVGNNISLGSGSPLLLISGSNMSGKSTLLRGVGLNVVLAMCGVPVCARRMRVSAFKVGATLSIHDSLMSGQSRFYAEISRIQELVKISRSDHTLLFLIDEILHGTNSFDRRKGARAILESMLNDGSVGFVTTHDLALAQMADDWPDRATNMHLSDRLDGQALVFDYRLRPGVVQQSNAIELMRSVGLPV